MSFMVNGWDGTKIKVDSTDILVAKQKAREYLDGWMEKDDRVFFFNVEKPGNLLAVVYAYGGEATDARCTIVPCQES